MTSTISVHDLRVAYGRAEILKGISLDFPAGAVTAIIGPSGCGKTTLLTTLNRLIELTKDASVTGEIRLDGRNVLRLDPILLRRRVGMVFQKPNPFPMSIRENVLYGIKAAGLAIDRESALEASLKRAALWDEVRTRLGAHAFRLSLGQQQRLCLARCLAISPGVILMDEPTASLDPTSAARIEDSVRQLRGAYTVIIVTHNLAQARRVSDQTAFLHQGVVVEVGETQSLFEAPRMELTRRYIGGVLEGAVA